eukprot:752618-Pleurochrysis_carterae.AAC.1
MSGTLFVPDTCTLSGGVEHFTDNASLLHVVLEKTATPVAFTSAARMFKGCSSLLTFNATNRFAGLGSEMFAGCTALERFTTLQSLTVGADSFDGDWGTAYNGTTMAPGLYVKTGAGVFAYFDGTLDYAHVAPGSSTVTDYSAVGTPGAAGTLVIGSSVASISNSRFSGHTSLQKVDFSLAQSLTAIADHAFRNLTFEYLVLPTYNAMTTGSYTFAGPNVANGAEPKLEVYVPANVTEVAGYGAFLDSAMTKMTYAPAAAQGTETLRTSSFNRYLTHVDIGNRFSTIAGHCFLGSSAIVRFISARSFKVTNTSSMPFSSLFNDVTK